MARRHFRLKYWELALYLKRSRSRLPDSTDDGEAPADDGEQSGESNQ